MTDKIKLPTRPDQLLFMVIVPCGECRGMGCYSCNHKGTMTLGLSLLQVAPLVKETLDYLNHQAQSAAPEGQGGG